VGKHFSLMTEAGEQIAGIHKVWQENDSTNDGCHDGTNQNSSCCYVFHIARNRMKVG